MSNTRGLKCEDSGATVKAETVEEEIGAILRNMQLPDDWQDEIREAVVNEDDRQRLMERRHYLEGKLRRLGMAFADGAIKEPDYIRGRDAAKAELVTLVIPENTAVIDAGLYLETLRDLWDEAALEERRDICRLMLEAVYYDLRREHVTELIPKPPFLPLFRGISVLEEKKEQVGHFRVLPAARGNLAEEEPEA
jgi:hypothetical protein